MDIPIDQFVPLAQLIGLGILGILAAAGIWWGKRKPTDRTVELAGALVDSGSIKMLTAAIEAQTMEMIQTRNATAKAAEAQERVAHALETLADKRQADMNESIEDLASKVEQLISDKVPRRR